MLEVDDVIEAAHGEREIAHRFLEIADAGEEARIMCDELLETGEDGWIHESVAQRALGLGSECWAELAALTDYSIDGARFRFAASEIARTTIDETSGDCTLAVIQRLAATAATVGFKLARHYSEKALAEEIGGVVAAQEHETASIDVFTADGETVQVFTSRAENPDTANEKMSEEARERVDYYVVLHTDAMPEGFGVGVTDLNNPENNGKYSAGVRARDNARGE